jgi:hypothetical protein
MRESKKAPTGVTRTKVKRASPKPRSAHKRMAHTTDVPDVAVNRIGVDIGERLLIPIALLVENPNNERKQFREMDGMIESVRSAGVVEPIIVKRVAGGRFQIVSGHRRTRAAIVAGHVTIDAIVRGDSENVLRRISLISNIQRESLGPIELAEALHELLDGDDRWTQLGTCFTQECSG